MNINYEIYDESLPQIKEDTLIFKNKTVESYLHGSCHLFALVFAKKYNLKIKGLFSEIEADTESGFIDALDHAYCVLDTNIAIDAKGQNHISEIKMFSIDSFNAFEIEDSKEIIESWISNGLLHDFEEGEEESILAFINECDRLNLFKKLSSDEEEVIMDFLENKLEKNKSIITNKLQ